MHPVTPPNSRVRLEAKLGFGLVLMLLAVAACGPTPGATSGPAATGPAATSVTSTEAAATSGAGGDLTAVCRHLTNLKSLDYAFDAPFSVVSSLAAESKAQTLADLQTFRAEAPAELQASVDDLIAVWTELSQSGNSVTETDPRLVGAAATLGAWLPADCA